MQTGPSTHERLRPVVTYNYNFSVYIHTYIAYIHEVEMRRSANLDFGYRKEQK